MTDLPAFSGNRFVFFVSRLLILAGMVIFFTFLSSLAGYFFCKFILHQDILRMNEMVEDPAANADGIRALKWFQLISSVGTFMVPAFLFARSLNYKPTRFLRITQPVQWHNIAIAVILIVVSVPVISWLYSINQSMTFPERFRGLEQKIRSLEDAAAKVTEAFMLAESVPALLFNLLVVAVIPAIAEEFFFRGTLQNFVRMCFYNPHIAIIFTALLFSGFHGQFYGFLPRLALGVILGYLFFFSGSIWVPVTAHMLNNGLALVSAYYEKRHPDLEFLRDNYVFPFYMIILSAAITIVMLVWMNRLRYKTLRADGE
jgi:hypothetical protein